MKKIEISNIVFFTDDDKPVKIKYIPKINYQRTKMTELSKMAEYVYHFLDEYERLENLSDTDIYVLEKLNKEIQYILKKAS